MQKNERTGAGADTRKIVEGAKQPEIFLKLSGTEQKVRCFFCKKLTVCSDVENSIIHGHHMASVSAGCNRTVIAILTLKGGRRTGPNGSGATRVADSQ